MRPHKATNKTGVTAVKGAAYVPCWKSKINQEYIPVGCVPPASVAVSPARTPPPPPCTPPATHTTPRHARPLLCMSPTMHIPLLCMPPTTHPPATHAPLPCMPLSPGMHTSCHAHLLPCTPPAMHTSCHAHLLPCTPVWTDRCKNITFPQLRSRAVKWLFFKLD